MLPDSSDSMKERTQTINNETKLHILGVCQKCPWIWLILKYDILCTWVCQYWSTMQDGCSWTAAQDGRPMPTCWKKTLGRQTYTHWSLYTAHSAVRRTLIGHSTRHTRPSDIHSLVTLHRSDVHSLVTLHGTLGSQTYTRRSLHTAHSAVRRIAIAELLDSLVLTALHLCAKFEVSIY